MFTDRRFRVLVYDNKQGNPDKPDLFYTDNLFIVTADPMGDNHHANIQSLVCGSKAMLTKGVMGSEIGAEIQRAIKGKLTKRGVEQMFDTILRNAKQTEHERTYGK